MSDADVAGRWTGRWIGTGLFESPRDEDVTLDLVQRGDAGQGRLVFDGAIAAESLAWEVRQQGLSGIRVFADISGDSVTLTHAVDRRLFTADLTVVGDRMVGDVRGSAPGVRLLLSRVPAAPQAAQAVPAPPAAPSEPVKAEPEAPIVVLAPPPEPVEPPKLEEPAPRPRIEEFVAVSELQSVYFGFDEATLSPEAMGVLTRHVTWLKDNDDTVVLIEGYCDERGTSEYNLVLGERRAKSVMDYLTAYGVPRARMSTVSYGKERPVCSEPSEECMTQNRRAAFRIKTR